MAKGSLPAIPDIFELPVDTDESLVKILKSIKEHLEVYNGRANALDRAVTRRDLQNLGFDVGSLAAIDKGGAPSSYGGGSYSGAITITNPADVRTTLNVEDGATAGGSTNHSQGPTASLPASGTEGDTYFATDTEVLYTYDGSYWQATATYGANWGTDINSQPADGDILNANQTYAQQPTEVKTAIASDGSLRNYLQGTGNVGSTPSGGQGLYLGADYLGFYSSSSGWITYMDHLGYFYLGGLGNRFLEWDGAALTVKGDIKTADSGERVHLNYSTNRFHWFNSGGSSVCSIGTQAVSTPLGSTNSLMFVDSSTAGVAGTVISSATSWGLMCFSTGASNAYFKNTYNSTSAEGITVYTDHGRAVAAYGGGSSAGVYATSGSGYGVYASSTTGIGLYVASGGLTVASGSISGALNSTTGTHSGTCNGTISGNISTASGTFTGTTSGTHSGPSTGTHSGAISTTSSVSLGSNVSAYTATGRITANGGIYCDGNGTYGLNVTESGATWGINVTGTNTEGVRSRGSSYAYYAIGHSGGDAYYGPFTGAHDGLLVKNTPAEPGDILVDLRPVSKSGIADVLCENTLSSMQKQKNVVGVFVKINPSKDFVPSALVAELGPDAEDDEVKTKKFKKYRDTEWSHLNLIIFNALGEGQMNVCKEGGDIEIGDFICSSSRPGKGMKQDDDLLHNYTVAKAREAVSWGAAEDDIKMIAVTYHCG